MRLKKSKQEVLNEILSVSYPYATFGHSNVADMSPNQFKQAVEQYAKDCARSAVQQAMTKLIELIYTQEEFERDLTLSEEQKSKS